MYWGVGLDAYDGFILHHAPCWSVVWYVVWYVVKCFLTVGAEIGCRSFERPGVHFKGLPRPGGFDLLGFELGGPGSATK